jgi:hypothetical protein
MSLKGYFKSRFELQGSDWIKQIPVEDRKAFMSVNFAKSDFGRTGGKVRAQTAKRDSRGKFTRN